MSTSQTSLIIIAVQTVLNKGKNKFSQLEQFSSFYMVTSIEKNTVPKNMINDFLTFMVDDCMGSLSKSLGDQKNSIAANLEIIRDISALDDGPASACAVNQVFDQSKGKMFTWMYSFHPKNSDVISETLTISFDIRLYGNFVILYNTKKSIFGERRWNERKYVPPSITTQTVVDTLCIGLAPFLFNTAPSPSFVIEELKNQAKTTPYISPNDISPILYDPILKSYVKVNDPEILKLLPTIWVKSSGNFFLNEN